MDLFKIWFQDAVLSSLFFYFINFNKAEILKDNSSYTLNFTEEVNTFFCSLEVVGQSKQKVPLYHMEECPVLIVGIYLCSWLILFFMVILEPWTGLLILESKLN